MVPLVTNACVSGVTRMLLGTNATLFLSALLCNACGTSMLLCLLVTTAQCNSSCGKQIWWVWRILSEIVLPC